MIQIKNANGKVFLKFSETQKPYFLKSCISKRGYGSFWLHDAVFFAQGIITSLPFLTFGAFGMARKA
jgi:hypothetical protein